MIKILLTILFLLILNIFYASDVFEQKHDIAHQRIDSLFVRVDAIVGLKNQMALYQELHKINQDCLLISV